MRLVGSQNQPAFIVIIFVIPMHTWMYLNIVSDVQIKKAVKPTYCSCKTIACKYKGEARAKRLLKLQHKK